MSNPLSVKEQRPLSPHLQVYRPQITSAMSIFHRITGVTLAFGSVIIVAWLWGLAYCPELYTCLSECAQQWYGKLVLIGWSGAFFYHLGNGIRHLFWDMGKGFELATVTRSGLLVLAFAILATAALWFTILGEAS